jgi:hypothetical protein
MGVDGAWVQVENLTIEQRKFKPVDLTQPVQVDRKFDLAISVEVAEHLTSDSAPVLIQSACRLADVVLFSAAIPLQGGTNHINEQWPEYWAAHFSANDYLCYDYLRPLLWSEDGIEYYYRQNLLLFIREGTTSDYAQTLLKTVSPYRTAKPMPLVHPVKYMELATFANVDNRMLLKKLPSIIYDVTRRRLKALVSRRTQ